MTAIFMSLTMDLQTEKDGKTDTLRFELMQTVQQKVEMRIWGTCVAEFSMENLSDIQNMIARIIDHMQKHRDATVEF